jgi:hypothetical protein
LPIYVQAFARGRDVGLRIGLDALTAERARLADDLIIANATDEPRRAAVVTYADGRLQEVARRIAAIFPQATS